MKLRDIAERLRCRMEGDGSVEILRVAGIEHAGPGDLTFVADHRYAGLVSSTRASAIILGAGRGDDSAHAPCSVLRCDDPRLAFAHAVRLLVPVHPPPPGIDRHSVIANDVTLGRDVSIGPFVTIGAGAVIGDRTIIHSNAAIGDGARVGDDCVIHSHVAIRERVQLGSRVVVQNGAVIGSDGFGFVKQADGTHLKITQAADVVIEDDVEIGANTTIDRPAVGETRVRAGAKIDNLVQIAHGVSVGRRSLLAAQVGVAGSTIIEEDVVLAGQVGIAGHLHIGKGVVATAQTGIPNSVEDGELISGYPAIPNRDWLKSSAIFRKLPDLKKRVAELEQRLAQLEAKIHE